MEKLYVVSIDEEFEKARTKGARDMKKRRRRGRYSDITKPASKDLAKLSRELDHITASYYESGPGGGRMTGALGKKYKSKMLSLHAKIRKLNPLDED